MVLQLIEIGAHEVLQLAVLLHEGGAILDNRQGLVMGALKADLRDTGNVQPDQTRIAPHCLNIPLPFLGDGEITQQISEGCFLFTPHE